MAKMQIFYIVRPLGVFFPWDGFLCSAGAYARPVLSLLLMSDEQNQLLAPKLGSLKP
jgi:hypothetical protein